MRALTLFPYYVHWHYGQALRDGAAIYKNFIWFIWHFFSIGILMRTFFDTWERMHEEPEHKFDFSSILSAWTINIIVRGAGAVMRSAIILVGLLCIATVTFAALLVFCFWLALPLCIIIFYVVGIVFLTRSV